MKKFVLSFVMALICYAAAAQTIDIGKFTIDKNNCTITRKADGKTFPLHGRVEIVESAPDLRIEIVDHNSDVRAMPHYNPYECGMYDIVESAPVLRVEIVESAPDLTVEIVDHNPGINR